MKIHVKYLKEKESGVFSAGLKFENIVKLFEQDCKHLKDLKKSL